jgi:2-polyprenyl-3-methyl-5-hydroxy-6-metoxy-1,4-benzoquinol methylase
MSAYPDELSYVHAFNRYKDECRRLVDEHGLHDLCEIGGGRSPLFDPEEIREMGITYTVLDISPEEIALAPAVCEPVCADICTPPQPGNVQRFDFMFSRFVAEHVTSGDAMHRNVRSMLRPGGIAFHLYPTLYSPAFVANRLLPKRLTAAIMARLFGYTWKFPARYSRCTGPTRRMRLFLETLGYEILEFRPFYGTWYFDRLPILRTMDDRFTSWAANRQSAYFTSYAYLIMRRPHPAAGEPPHSRTR